VGLRGNELTSPARLDRFRPSRPHALRVANAASTVTLVVVALSGGTGALLGAILGQAVQLHRDKKQYEREDARHERERNQAVEDARTARREERYIDLLTDLDHFKRSLGQYRNIVEAVTLALRSRDAWGRQYLVHRLRDAESCYSDLLAFQDRLAATINAAYPVASSRVRQTGRELMRFTTLSARWRWSRTANVIDDFSQWEVERAVRAEDIEQMASALWRCDALDDLVRGELRID
jgi:hypothetical protein